MKNYHKHMLLLLLSGALLSCGKEGSSGSADSASSGNSAASSKAEVPAPKPDQLEKIQAIFQDPESGATMAANLLVKNKSEATTLEVDVLYSQSRASATLKINTPNANTGFISENGSYKQGCELREKDHAHRLELLNKPNDIIDNFKEAADLEKSIRAELAMEAGTYALELPLFDFTNSTRLAAEKAMAKKLASLGIELKRKPSNTLRSHYEMEIELINSLQFYEIGTWAFIRNEEFIYSLLEYQARLPLGFICDLAGGHLKMTLKKPSGEKIPFEVPVP